MSASKTTRSQLSKMQWETCKAIYFAQKPMAWNMRSETIRSLQRRGQIDTDKTGQVIVTEAGRQLMAARRARHAALKRRYGQNTPEVKAVLNGLNLTSTERYVSSMLELELAAKLNKDANK